MSRKLSELEHAKAAIDRKRRHITILQAEIKALEEMVDVLRRTQEVVVHAREERRGWRS